MNKDVQDVLLMFTGMAVLVVAVIILGVFFTWGLTWLNYILPVPPSV